MPENRNTVLGPIGDGRGTVCIDTRRVLDCCRDRDCFENTRVFVSSASEAALENATNIRTRAARILWAYVGVDEVPFNRGFYHVTVRYYVDVECEACLGIGRSQTIRGLSVLEKDVILYGGEGNATSFSSSPENTFCRIGDLNTVGNNAPVAVVETVDPVVLGTKIVECGCPAPQNECMEIPDNVRSILPEEYLVTNDGARLYVSFGIFSVIRIERPAQLLVTASDYSVPDKECIPARSEDNPCALFQAMPFPIGEFRATTDRQTEDRRPTHGICGCSQKNTQ